MAMALEGDINHHSAQYCIRQCKTPPSGALAHEPPTCRSRPAPYTPPQGYYPTGLMAGKTGGCCHLPKFVPP